jgi:hypothetical protein
MRWAMEEAKRFEANDKTSVAKKKGPSLPSFMPNLRLKYVIQDEGVRLDAMLSIVKRRQSLKIRDCDSLERVGRRDFRNDSCSYGFVSASCASTIFPDNSRRLSSLAGRLSVYVSFRTSGSVLGIRDGAKIQEPCNSSIGQKATR